ncbi:unnamed protein product [Lymnaea stagnalis]|uniref:Uncharacterized protein n=1 Tax=Lymnaea stagnalis TaxID=6523 RepID=A0AAV2HD06_LYMST
MSCLIATSLAVLLGLATFVTSVKDGTEVDQCGYPGLVAVLAPNDAIVCNGILISGTLVVPQICGVGMDEFLKSNDLTLVYGNGTRATIPTGTSGTLTGGLYSYTITNPLGSACNIDATVYNSDSDTLDTSTCEVVGFGSDSLSSKIYDGVVYASTLTKSSSSPCCDVIMNSLTSSQKGVILDSTASFNCLIATGAVCGSGDLGAPVYCNTTSGATVVTGLTSSTPCASSDTFLVHDLTQGATNFKFGY